MSPVRLTDRKRDCLMPSAQDWLPVQNPVPRYAGKIKVQRKGQASAASSGGITGPASEPPQGAFFDGPVGLNAGEEQGGDPSEGRLVADN